MKFFAFLAFLFLPVCAIAQTSQQNQNVEKNMENPLVTLKTNLGEIVLELYPEKAPETVKNFIGYVKNGHYNGTIFHRVIDGFMIQGGGFTEEMQQKQTKQPILNEANNQLKNKRGTIAMARTADIHSATAQFFINVSDNTFLNFKEPTPSSFGYCVFGKVISGMEVVDKIKAVTTTTKGMYQDVPKDSIVILETILQEGK